MSHPAIATTCPFCRAASTELISQFGSQLLLSQYRCTACGTYFEGLRQDGEDVVPSPRGGQNGSRAEH